MGVEIVIRRAELIDVEKIVRLSNDGGLDGKAKSVLPVILPEGYVQAFRRIDSDPKNMFIKFPATIESVPIRRQYFSACWHQFHSILAKICRDGIAVH